MVDRDIETARIDRALVGSELDLPEYPDLTSAPNRAGLTVHVTGDGADAAGAYTYAGGAWSGPHGGPSNLPDTTLESGSVANTAIYSYGDYLTGSVDPNNAKHVVADIDRAATDERYLRRVEDSFDTHDATTAPESDPPSAPTTWAFVPGSGSADATGGWFYGDTPPSTESRRSFGCGFTTTTAPDGSTVSSGTWALEKEYRVGSGGGDLRVGAWTQPMAAYSAYDDSTSHTSDESFVGEDDAFIEIRAYDSSLQPLDVGITTRYSRTASHQAFADGRTTDLGGDEWVSFGHTAALPAATVYVEVVLQTADTSNTWETRGTVGGGNAALLVDDFHAEYTSGLQPSAVLEHDHDERYLEDSAGSVAPNNLQFDPATQNEITDGETVNAGQLDGLDSGQFLRSDQNDSISGDLTVSGNIYKPHNSTLQFEGTGNDYFAIRHGTSSPADYRTIWRADGRIQHQSGPVTIDGNEIWHGGNLSNPARQSDLHTRYSDDEARSALSGHTGDTTNPHNVSAGQVGASPSGHDHAGDSALRPKQVALRDRASTPIAPQEGTRIYNSNNGHSLHGGPNEGTIWTDGTLPNPVEEGSSPTFSGTLTVEEDTDGFSTIYLTAAGNNGPRIVQNAGEIVAVDGDGNQTQIT